MKKILFLLLLSNTLGIHLFGQSFVTKDSIFEKSVKDQKSVFILFSGSDWCANCMRFEKKVLDDPSFQQFLKTNVLFLNADFPQRKKLNGKLIEQNEWLAEQYNPDGIFPTLLLVTPEQKIVPLTYTQETASQFIDKMKNAMNH